MHLQANNIAVQPIQQLYYFPVTRHIHIPVLALPAFPIRVMHPHKQRAPDIECRNCKGGRSILVARRSMNCHPPQRYHAYSPAAYPAGHEIDSAIVGERTCWNCQFCDLFLHLSAQEHLFTQER